MTPEIRAALGDVTFGPMAVLSIRTDETSPMPWDDLYSVLTPDLRFNMFFNHANFMHGVGPKQGSVIMVYGGGRRAGAARRVRGHGARRVPRRPRPDVPAGAPAHRRDLGQGLGARGAVRRPRAVARAGGARPRHRRPHLPGRRLGLRVRLDGDRRADGEQMRRRTCAAVLGADPARRRPLARAGGVNRSCSAEILSEDAMATIERGWRRADQRSASADHPRPAVVPRVRPVG